MSKDKVILAYSGGLDTSCILKWLLDQNYEVICYMANVGQKGVIKSEEEKARNIGASEVVIEDLKEDFLKNYILPSISAGLIYESRYLLGTALARPCISVGLVKCAKKFGAKYISHGATGKGNDQIRFELSCYYLWPEVKIIAPWRLEEFCIRFQGRQDLLKFAKLNEIPVPITPKAPWSMDSNLMHASYESGILEDPKQEPPVYIYLMTKDPKHPYLLSTKLEIEFSKGKPSVLRCKDKVLKDELKIFELLNDLGGLYGLGRIDIVENRFIGLKSRGVYETPAGYILYKAHEDLEVFCLDKEVYRVKQGLRDKLADYVYNGFWFSPEGNYVRKCIEIAEENVNGCVQMEIITGAVIIKGRSSPSSTYNKSLVSMDEHADFSPQDATGFINIQAIRLKEYRRVNGAKDSF